MESIGIIYKYRYKPAEKEALKLEGWLQDRGLSVYLEEMAPPDRLGSSRHPSHSKIPESVDWLVVLGGDGTLLGAARQVGRYGVPILGVNLGGLGFMAEIPLKKLYAAVEMMLEGKLEWESRLMLEAVVQRGDEDVCRSLVLNDVVINKNALARILDMDVYIDDQFLTSFRADGLIVSTPTGSTAYNLSAGGPVVYPTLLNIILSPICPFTLSNRPIILSETATVRIDISKNVYEEVSLTLDGQVGFELISGDRVLISKSNQRIRLIKSPYQTYFEILRTKLGWGGGTGRNEFN